MSGIHITIGSAQAAQPRTDLKQLFQKPLIVGASVSGDYFTESPGKLLALNYTSADQIKVIAQNGKPSTYIMNRISDSVVQDRSIIVGVDLFFWDSFSASAGATIEQMDRLVDLSEKHKVPLVLGEIPTLLPGTQKSALAINKKMHEICLQKAGCYILPLHDLMMKTLTEGYMEFNGQRYGLESLVPDGLHIGRPASQYLANQIKNIFQQSR